MTFKIVSAVIVLVILAACYLVVGTGDNPAPAAGGAGSGELRGFKIP